MQPIGAPDAASCARATTLLADGVSDSVWSRLSSYGSAAPIMPTGCDGALLAQGSARRTR